MGGGREEGKVIVAVIGVGVKIVVTAPVMAAKLTAKAENGKRCMLI